MSIFSFIVNVSKLVICFKTDILEIVNYLKREFPYYTHEDTAKYDLLIEITNKNFVLPKGVHCIKKNTIYTLNNNIFQCIKAKGNHVWVMYETSKVITKHITIYLSYKITNSYIERFIHPTFMPRWQCSLFNFIHGAFLGIVQMYLISYGETFLHAASFCSNNRGIALAGNAQSGKSTFAKLISKDESKHVISEDFCILNDNNEILSYPKQCRIYINQLRDTMYYIDKKKIYLFFDKLNVILYTPFKILGIRPLRRLTLEEIFGNCILQRANIDKIYFIKRDAKEFRITNCTENEFVTCCTSSMMEELKNLAGFYDLIEAFDQVMNNYECNSINTLALQISECYKKVYRISDCYFAEIPFYHDLESMKSLLYKIDF